MPEWVITEGGVDVAEAPSSEQLQSELRAEQELNLLMSESIADLELALEDKGWSRTGLAEREEFTYEGRRALRSLCRTMVTANPLIKRGTILRIGYIWGQGVQVSALAGEEADQDVNAVVQDFWDHNEKTLTGSQAQEENERALCSDGEVLVAAFTNPLTGKVKARTTPTDEIVDIITNPEDRDEVWFYIRSYVETEIQRGRDPKSATTKRKVVKVAHPDLAYRPRPADRIDSIDGAEVRWDAPILHIPVNRLDGWKHGVPDVYAAVAWARAYKDFLTDWALLAKSLATFAWRASGGTKTRAANQAAKLASAGAVKVPGTPANPTGQRPVGQVAVGDQASTLEAIPKSGAQIDANSGKPLAGMAAAGIGIPVTMLLADPGITGARATAETLDLPTVLEMSMRRLLWQQKLTELLTYVIDQAVIAPLGPLDGTLTVDDWGQDTVTLASDVEKTIDWDWPPIIDIDPIEFLKALVAVEGTGKVPDLVIVKLMLKVMGVKDVDEIMKKVTDSDGRFIDPSMVGQQAAMDEERRRRAAGDAG